MMKKKIAIKKVLFLFIFGLVLLLTACDSAFGIAVGYKKQEMYVGEELLLQVNIDEINGTVTWESTDETVATVDQEGLVKALKAGYTYIVVSSGEDSTKVYLVVKEKDGGATSKDVKKTITITGNQTIALKSSQNSTVKLTASVTNGEAKDKVLWVSSDDSVATVDANGLVTGVKTGVVSIKAYLSTDDTVSCTLPIIVRTADGVQNIIENHIVVKNYVVEGELDLTSLSNKVVDVVSKYADSVIGVSNYQYTTDIFGRQSTTASKASVGSGVIYKKEAQGTEFKYTVLTNNHVVKDNAFLKVYLGDLDKEVEATLVKADANLDLAIVTFVSSRNYEVIEFETVDNYQTGDFVIAVGNPTGYDYYGSVTFGVLSYKNREMSGESAVFLQHDAAINPGNSGGALLNLDGKLIGINTLKIATTEVEGMGFAVSMKSIAGFLGINE